VVVGKNSNGQDKKVSRVEYKHTPPNEPIAYLKPQLHDFIAHNFCGILAREGVQILLSTYTSRHYIIMHRLF
jgi:hypothetical protein